MLKLVPKIIPFVMAQVNEAKMEVVGRKNIIKVKFPSHSTFNVNVSKEGRRLIEKPQDHKWVNEQLKLHEEGKTCDIANKQNPLRWSAGGGLTIFNYKGEIYLVTAYRDKKAPGYPNTLTLSSGISSYIEELYDPIRVMFREWAEEIILYDSKGRLVIPNIKNKVYQGLVEKAVIEAAQDAGFKFKKLNRDINANVIKKMQGSTLYVMNPKMPNTAYSKVDCIFSWDPKVSGMDILNVFEIKENPFKFKFYYSEGFIDKNGKFKLLNNNIFLIPLSSLKKMRNGKFKAFKTKQGSKFVEGNYNIKFTPVLHTLYWLYSITK